MNNKPLIKFQCDTIPFDHGGTIVYVMVAPNYETCRQAFPVPSVSAGIKIADKLNEAMKGIDHE